MANMRIQLVTLVAQILLRRAGLKFEKQTHLQRIPQESWYWL